MGSSGLRRFAFVCLAAGSAVSCGLLVDTSGLSGTSDPADGATAVDGATDAGSDVAQTLDSSSGVDSAFDAGKDAASISYRDVVLADGPIAYYRLADNGSVAKDETGSHHGTYAGLVEYNQSGPAAGVPSVRFKGSAHVAANSVATLPVGTFASYTLEAFVALEVQGTSTFFLNFAAAGGGGGPSLWVDDQTEKFRYSVPGTIIDSTIVIGLTWHHLAVTASGTMVSIYVDGVFDKAATINDPAPDRGAFTIGTNFSAGVDGGAAYYNSSFKGRLAEVAIYGKALSATQIAAHYAARP